MSNDRLLPFKPFTLDEVCKVTGVAPVQLTEWLERRLVMQQGEGEHGLTYMQTFAVFVGKKWMDEGSGPMRAGPVVQMIADYSHDQLMLDFYAGQTFPSASHGIMVPTPKGTLGMRLDCKNLYDEFKARIAAVFPGG